MRPITATLGAFVMLFAGTAAADEASRTARAEELLRLLNVEQNMKMMLDQMRAMQSQQLAQSKLSQAQKEKAAAVQSKINTLMAGALSWDKLKPEFVKLYAQEFSEQELTAMVGFYKSPAGQAFIQKMPALTKKGMLIAQQRVQALMPEIERLSREGQQK